MKYRTGFVSNSSSSSFVCDVCGRSISGFNLNIKEADMFQCVAEHTFCQKHSVNDIEKMITQIKEHKEEFGEDGLLDRYRHKLEVLAYYYSVDRCYCPICQDQNAEKGITIGDTVYVAQSKRIGSLISPRIVEREVLDINFKKNEVKIDEITWGVSWSDETGVVWIPIEHISKDESEAMKIAVSRTEERIKKIVKAEIQDIKEEKKHLDQKIERYENNARERIKEIKKEYLGE